MLTAIKSGNFYTDVTHTALLIFFIEKISSNHSFFLQIVKRSEQRELMAQFNVLPAV